MRKYMMVLLFFVFGFLNFNVNLVSAYDVGCTATSAYSVSTGKPCTGVKNNSSPSQELKIGSRGSDVKKLQQVLKDEGYYLGKIDGNYGKRTAKAVKNFQDDNDITVTGGADINTLKKIEIIGNVVFTSITTYKPPEYIVVSPNQTVPITPKVSVKNTNPAIPEAVTGPTQDKTVVVSPLTKTITTTHRSGNGLFSGWGPHLGHLLRDTDDSLWFVDDTGSDPLINPALAYHHLVNGQWSQVATLPMLGRVQQNVGSVLGNNRIIYSYGIDVDGNKVEECYFNTTTNAKGCVLLPFTLTDASNYIGAAISPSGIKIVWWTNVVDGGAGSFQHIYNTGGGWSEPITSTALGYNDLGYVNIAFKDNENFVMVAQGVTGLAPNWTYHAVYGEGNVRTPITWQNLFSGFSDDPAQSTYDIWVDPQGGTHVLAKGLSGGAQYFYKPHGGTLSSSAVNIIPVSSRARFVDSDDGKIHLIYGLWVWREGVLFDDFIDLAYSKNKISGPIPWNSITPDIINLPTPTGDIWAIYPESKVYQTTTVKGVNVAINNKEYSNVVTHVQYNSPKIIETPSVITISATPETVNSGEYSTISGSATNMKYCVLSGGAYGTDGQQTLIPDFSGWSGTLTQNTTFTIKCKGNNGIDYEKSITVIVSKNVPIVLKNVSINKTTYVSGDSILITAKNPNPTAKDWLAIIPAGTKLTGCCAGIPWVYADNAKATTKTLIANVPSGTYEVAYFANDTFEEIIRSEKFTITSQVNNLPITVTSGPVTFSANPGIVSLGSYSTLSVSATSVTSCIISGGAYGNGQQTSVPTWSGWTGVLTEDTTFTMQCTGVNDESHTLPITIKVKN